MWVVVQIYFDWSVEGIWCWGECKCRFKWVSVWLAVDGWVLGLECVVKYFGIMAELRGQLAIKCGKSNRGSLLVL